MSTDIETAPAPKRSRSRPGRPKVTETPEFDQAVQRALETKLAEFERRLLASVPAVSSNGDVMAEILDRLSVNMQAVAQQGDRRKPLTAEEIRKREDSYERMKGLILASREPGAERPEYKVVGKLYLQERFIEPFRLDPATKQQVHNVIAWTGEPSEGMVPLNETAKAIFDAWLGYTGGRSGLVPTADNRPLWVTAAGLTVRGDPPKRRTAMDQDYSGGDGSELRVSNDPMSETVAVLGTVAPRARQNTIAGVK